jgi:hypothetical protein
MKALEKFSFDGLDNFIFDSEDKLQNVTFWANTSISSIYLTPEVIFGFIAGMLTTLTSSFLNSNEHNEIVRTLFTFLDRLVTVVTQDLRLLGCISLYYDQSIIDIITSDENAHEFPLFDHSISNILPQKVELCEYIPVEENKDKSFDAPPSQQDPLLGTENVKEDENKQLSAEKKSFATKIKTRIVLFLFRLSEVLCIIRVLSLSSFLDKSNRLFVVYEGLVGSGLSIIAEFGKLDKSSFPFEDIHSSINYSLQGLKKQLKELRSTFDSNTTSNKVD